MIAPRRWFQFSLRTMLVAVTLVCCWLGYSLNWIRERHEFLSRAETEPWFAIAISSEHAIQANRAFFGKAPPVAPLLLRLFGEGGVAVIVICADEPLRMQHAKGLFPEATLSNCLLCPSDELLLSPSGN